MKTRIKKLFVLLVILFNFLLTNYGQCSISKNRKREIERQSRWIFQKNTKFPSTLAAKLTNGLEDEESKVYALTYYSLLDY